MCTEMLRISVGEYRKRASEFFALVKRKVEMPFEEMYFIEAVSTAYELLQKGKKVDGMVIRFATAKNIVNAHPNMSWLKVFMKCGAVIDAVKDGDKFDWSHYCEECIRRIYPDTQLQRINYLRCMVAEYKPYYMTYTARYFAHVVFAAFACVGWRPD